MAKRRKLRRAVSAGADAFSQSLQALANRMHQQQLQQENYLFQNDLQRRSAEDAATRAETADTERLISEGKLDPGQRRGDEPSIARRLGTIIDPIGKAGNVGDVPSESELDTRFKAQRVPLVADFGRIPQPKVSTAINGVPDTDEVQPLPSTQFGNVTSPQRQEASKVRRATIERFPPTTQKRYDTEIGADVEQDVRFDPDAQPGGSMLPLGAPRQIAATGAQKGASEQDAWRANQGDPARVRTEIDIANQTERGTRAEKVTTSGQTAATSETARLNTYFRPEYVAARLQEGVSRVIAEAAAKGDQERVQSIRESANAAGRLKPFLSKITQLSAKLQGGVESGPLARIQGLVQRGANVIGMEEDISALETEIARNLRSLAVAQGIREANVTDADMKIIRDGIGIRPGQTVDERFNALLGLRDMIILGPVVGSSLPREADAAARLAAVEEAGRDVREVEDIARKQNKATFTDPVTGVTFDVIYK